MTRSLPVVRIDDTLARDLWLRVSPVLVQPILVRLAVRNALPVEWRAGAADDPDSLRFSVGAELGGIRVRGHLSTGTRGWVLRADAGVRRGVITLHVAAVESNPVRTPDLEFHQYEALINVRRPGSYSIRITHSYLPRGEPGGGFARPVHEASVTVP